MGEKSTWPMEPAAVPNPNARERRSGPITRAMAASTRENEAKATPTPTNTPPTRYSVRPVSAIAMPATPAAYATAPKAMTLDVPNRSAIAPATGTPMPHSRFWIASASAKVSRDQPRSVVIGSKYSPKLDRMPNPMSEIRHAAAITATTVRRQGRC